MNSGVAVQTRPADGPCACIASADRWVGVEAFRPGKRGAEMATGADMATLAEFRGLLIHQFVVIAAVGVVAGQAVFRNRGMLMQEGAALFSMALVAEVINRVGLQAFFAKRSMRIMTTRAGNLAFFNGVMGLPAGFSLDIFVAGKAQLGLGHLQVFRQAGMAGMTTTAGKASGSVLAGFPEGHMLAAAVTAETLGLKFLGGAAAVLAE